MTHVVRFESKMNPLDVRIVTVYARSTHRAVLDAYNQLPQDKREWYLVQEVERLVDPS